MLRAKYGLPSVEAEDETAEKKPPIRVKFEIPYFTVSGIQVSAEGFNAMLWSPVTPHKDLIMSWLLNCRFGT